MEKIMTREQKIKVFEQLCTIFADDSIKSAECPVCGGIVHIEYWGNSYEMKCETVGYIDFVSRGL